MPKVFLSHSSKDKAFARKLAEELTANGAQVWIDEAELKIGDSLIQRIGDAVADSDYMAVVLSQNSVQSSWVLHELSMAMSRELKERRVTVLPILKDKCDIPVFLRDKLYADFTDPANFQASLTKILRAVGITISTPARAATPPGPTPARGPSPPLSLGTPQPLQTFEDLQIVGVDRSRSSKPDPTKLLYNIYLELSSYPPEEWVQIFDAERQFPRHSMWRRAWIDGAHIVVSCTPEELSQYHLPDLREDVTTSNKKYREYLYRETAKHAQRAKRERADRDSFDSAIDKLKF